MSDSTKMNTIQPLEYDSYFHVYNRGINGEILFREDTNYEHFLRLYLEYTEPVAETYAWCLLKNHFHLLVRILPENEIEFMRTMDGDHRVFHSQKSMPSLLFQDDCWGKRFCFLQKILHILP